MDCPVIPSGSAISQSRMNAVRESDIRADPAYQQKLQFFNELNIKLLCLTNSMFENAQREARDIKSNLNVLISKISRTVQNMKLKDFCDEYGFELSNGELIFKQQGGAGDGTHTSSFLHTVQMPGRKDQRHFPEQSSGEVISQFQLIRGSSTSSYLRMSKNGKDYDLNQQGVGRLSETDKSVIRNEIAVFMNMLQNCLPK